MTKHETPAPEMSIVHGPPLGEQPNLGSLTLPGVLKDIAARYGPRECLVARRPDGTVERWSYQDLADRAMEVARALIAGGVTSHSRVGLMMSNQPEWLAAFFGIGLAGAVAVTLSTFSTPPELEFLLQTSGVSVVLFERRVAKKDFAAMLTALEPAISTARPGRLLSPKFPSLRRLVVLNDGAGGAIETWPAFLSRAGEIPPELVQAAAAAVTRADPGVIFFSSGSTGRPKGILSPHQAVAVQFWRWGWFMQLGEDARTLSANGFSWSGNFCQTVSATLSIGGAIVLQPVFDPVGMLKLMEAEKVTYPVAWPHQWAQLVEASNWNEVDLSSLRYLDAASPLARHPTVRKPDFVDPNWSYGNTETFTISTGYPANTSEEIAGGSNGAPLPGSVIKIVDPETGATLPRGQAGEIAAKGATLMLGYLGTPLAETLDEDGFFRCGDGGYIDERGRLVWQGRITDMIKTGGANVTPVEVDAVIETCPGVKLSRTVGVPHDTLGELVVACVVAWEGASLTEETIKAYARERLASYKCPRRVVLVGEEDLSLTGNAKVKTSALRELAAKRLAAEG